MLSLSIVNPTTASNGLGGEDATFAHVMLFGFGGLALFTLTHAFAYMRGEDSGRQQCLRYRRKGR
jgi:hypothetical protein